MKFSTRFAVFRRDGFCCQYCGRSGAESVLEIDHVLPRAAGGPDDLANLLTACHACNRGKGAQLITAPEEVDGKHDLPVRWGHDGTAQEPGCAGTGPQGRAPARQSPDTGATDGDRENGRQGPVEHAPPEAQGPITVKNPAAVALGRLAGQKSAAGRMKKLTPEQRQAIG
jgi:hypothetical protein